MFWFNYISAPLPAFVLGMQKVTVFIYRLTDPIYW